jgi:uncharacterized membrane protein
MSPFLAGALGALAVIVTLRLLRRAVWFGRMRRWRQGGRPPLRLLFRRLRTRPEQEEVLARELDALLREGGALRDDWRGARRELADLFTAEALDAAALSAALDRRMAKVGEARARAEAALARVHAALDPGQRVQLAALLAHGPGGWRHGCGPRRGPSPA